jgi:VIT1/CCC1 family predicted Fe2+/Mn2+ transporter
MRRAIQAHLDSHQVTRVIYGAIIGLSLVLVMERHPPGAGVAIATLIGTAVAVGLADFYSAIIGAETRTRQRPSRAQLRDISEESVFVMVGIAFPSVFFLLAILGVFDVDTAFTVAKWSGLGLICFYGFCGARLAGAGVALALAEGVGVGLIGALLIALKAIIH